VLRRNRINKNGYEANGNAAISVVRGGAGFFEENDLRGNAKGAWLISADSESKVVRKGNIEK
jgi:hypothetical protein